VGPSGYGCNNEGKRQICCGLGRQYIPAPKSRVSLPVGEPARKAVPYAGSAVLRGGASQGCPGYRCNRLKLLLSVREAEFRQASNGACCRDLARPSSDYVAMICSVLEAQPFTPNGQEAQSSNPPLRTDRRGRAVRLASGVDLGHAGYHEPLKGP